MTATTLPSRTPSVQPAADPDALHAFAVAAGLSPVISFDTAFDLEYGRATAAGPPGPTPVIAASGESVTSWLWRRVSLLEGQRQSLHRERDEARNAVAGALDTIGAQALTIARQRAHLAAAGRSLDELTAPASDAGDDDAGTEAGR